MATILSAAQWNLMRDPDPRAVMAKKPLLVANGSGNGGWRGLSGRKAPIAANGVPVLTINRALGDNLVRMRGAASCAE